MRRVLTSAFVLALLLSPALVPRVQAAHDPRVPNGYWLVGSDGGILSYGKAAFYGSTGGIKLNRPIVGMASTRSGNGYWTVASDGGIFAFGDAPFYGSTGSIRLNQPIVGMAPTPSGGGYWLVASDGGIFAFGDAPFFGSTGGIRLNQPIVGMAPTRSGQGYWLVASDGGIFAFGDAPFHGSTGAIRLNQPIVAMAPTSSGNGYWFTAKDGGIFAFGDAAFFGSAAGTPLAKPVRTMMATAGSQGYWLVTEDARVLNFGDAPFYGDGRDLALGAPIVGAAALHRIIETEVAIFYYPWHGNPEFDGGWQHWEQNGHQPQNDDIGANFFPSRDTYSNSDPKVLDAHMKEIAAAGVDVVVSSWWGIGSPEDKRLGLIVKAATAHGLRVAIHLEPYGGRSIASIDTDIQQLHLNHGVTEFWMYLANRHTSAEWQSLTSKYPAFRIMGESGRPTDIRNGTWAQFAEAAGFDGIYTYDPLRIPPDEFDNICRGARGRQLLCSPSVAPGHDNTRAGGTAVRDRANGDVYDNYWEGAVRAQADVVSITSYNEWHEGTQIEPATRKRLLSGYEYTNYDGSYGQAFLDAEDAYLERTRYWADIVHD